MFLINTADTNVQVDSNGAGKFTVCATISTRYKPTACKLLITDISTDHLSAVHGSLGGKTLSSQHHQDSMSTDSTKHVPRVT